MLDIRRSEVSKFLVLWSSKRGEIPPPLAMLSSLRKPEAPVIWALICMHDKFGAEADGSKIVNVQQKGRNKHIM